MSRERFKIETSNLSWTLTMRGTNDKNSKLGQRESGEGHVTYYLFLPSRSWSSFTDPGRMEGWVGRSGWLNNEINVQHLELNLDTVSHPGTNRARRTITSLIDTNAHTLRQTTCLQNSCRFVLSYRKDLALQQILSSIDLFLFYRTDYTDSQTMLNGCTAKCVRLSRPLVSFWTHFKSLHFHFISFHFSADCDGLCGCVRQMMCATPAHTMQQEICCLMSEVQQLRRDKGVFAGVVKQLQKDLSVKVHVMPLLYLDFSVKL